MRLIGYWIESLLDTNYLPPQEFVIPLEDGVRQLVSDYLDQGETYESYRGRSWCRFFCSREMGHREFSDGSWVWPEDLGHYIRDHGVTLPEEFLRHVLSGTARIPKSEWARLDVELDHEFWKGWCQMNSLGRYRFRIEEARRQAHTEAERLMADAAADEEAKEGLSLQRCVKAGCSHRALKNRALCATCYVRMEEWVLTAALYCDLRSLLDA